MNFFYHHVAKKGVPDLYKTVFSQVHVSVVEQVDDPYVQQVILPKIKTIFPDGYFNCWGAPDGAAKVIKGNKHLKAGDIVLLMTNPNAPNSMPVLCSVKLFDSAPMSPLSQALWGDEGFPFIFFFETERLSLDWASFKMDIGYDDKYRPQGTFATIGDDKIANLGGPDMYLQMLRERYSINPDTFQDIMPDELNTEEVEDNQNIDPTDLNDEIAAIKHMSEDKADDPPLTQPLITIENKRVSRDRAFSIVVRRAYNSRCAICGSGAVGPKGQSELHAAHIYPKSNKGSDLIQNGILLCQRHHWALDVGWISLSDAYQISAHSKTPKSSDYQFINEFKGRFLNVPHKPQERPHPKFLQALRKLQKKNFD